MPERTRVGAATRARNGSRPMHEQGEPTAPRRRRTPGRERAAARCAAPGPAARPRTGSRPTSTTRDRGEDEQHRARGRRRPRRALDAPTSRVTNGPHDDPAEHEDRATVLSSATWPTVDRDRARRHRRRRRGGEQPRRRQSATTNASARTNGSAEPSVQTSPRPTGSRRRRRRAKPSIADEHRRQQQRRDEQPHRPLGQDLALRDERPRSGRRRCPGPLSSAWTARSAARPKRCSDACETFASAPAACARRWPTAAPRAGPERPSSPCSPIVSGSARRAHCVTARGPPASLRRARARPRPGRCASAAPARRRAPLEYDDDQRLVHRARTPCRRARAPRRPGRRRAGRRSRARRRRRRSRRSSTRA